VIPTNERRRYPRVSLNHVTVEIYSATGEPDNPEFCFIINVSENGMLFKTDTKDRNYLANKLIRMTFVIPENNVIIRTDAMIIHVRETDLAAYIGAQFKNLGFAEQKILNEFVQKSLKDDSENI
jgi:c-di-GMP-binding flagellar brake protein YcgR